MYHIDKLMKRYGKDVNFKMLVDYFYRYIYNKEDSLSDLRKAMALADWKRDLYNTGEI